LVFVVLDHSETSGLISLINAESGDMYFKKEPNASHDKTRPTSSNSYPVSLNKSEFIASLYSSTAFARLTIPPGLYRNVSETLLSRYRQSGCIPQLSDHQGPSQVYVS